MKLLSELLQLGFTGSRSHPVLLSSLVLLSAIATQLGKLFLGLNVGLSDSENSTEGVIRGEVAVDECLIRRP